MEEKMSASREEKIADISIIQEGKVGEVGKDGKISEANTWQIPEQEIKRGMAGDEIEELMIKESGVESPDNNITAKKK